MKDQIIKNQVSHHSNQCNPNNKAHQLALNKHANQCNPNNSKYKEALINNGR